MSDGTPTSRLRPGEEGFTLVEILVALAILSIVAVTFVSVMGSLTLATQHHRGQGATDGVVRDFAEEAKEKAITATTYTACPLAADLTPVFAATGYTFTLTNVEYWIPATGNPLSGSFTSNRTTCLNYFSGITCTPTCEPGYQRAKLTVTATLPSFKGGKTVTTILFRRGNTT